MSDTDGSAFNIVLPYIASIFSNAPSLNNLTFIGPLLNTDKFVDAYFSIILWKTL